MELGEAAANLWEKVSRGVFDEMEMDIAGYMAPYVQAELERRGFNPYPVVTSTCQINLPQPVPTPVHSPPPRSCDYCGRIFTGDEVQCTSCGGLRSEEETYE